MIKRIAEGYGKMLGAAAKIIALLSVCALLGLAIVFPLWKFATSAPQAYTAAVLALMAAAAAVVCARRIKSAGIRKFLKGLLRIAVILCGAAAAIALVIAGKRIAAIPVAAAAVVLYGIISFGGGKTGKKTGKMTAITIIVAASAGFPLFGDAAGFPSADEMFSFVTTGEMIRIMNAKYTAPNPKADEETKSRMKAENEVFQKYEKKREKAERAQRRNENPALEFYLYKIKKSDVEKGKGFTQLAASLDQRQGTLATVNGIECSDDISEGMDLVLPVSQGLFVPFEPRNELEILIAQELSTQPQEGSVNVDINGRKYKFFPGKSFSGTAVAFFHDKGMQLPLSRKVLTSPFGYRTSPISGEWKFHAGIDLAAPVGTDVMACKGGTVAGIGQMNSVYGNFITIDHGGGKTSVYAHLSKMSVGKGDKVTRGQKIGEVGTTGMSTGPHLHFEIRENGNPSDPGKFIK